MGLALSSDLIVDVLRNGDPVKGRVAAARLTPTGPAPADSAFATVVDRMKGHSTGRRADNLIESVLAAANPGAASTAESKLALLDGEPSGSGAAGSPPGPSINTAFERMVLRNLYESMMPDPSSGTYGEGPSADIWRSLAADQLASVHSEAGGIGFGNLITKSGVSPGPSPQSQWPYFSVMRIDGFVG